MFSNVCMMPTIAKQGRPPQLNIILPTSYGGLEAINRGNLLKAHMEKLIGGLSRYQGVVLTTHPNHPLQSWHDVSDGVAGHRSNSNVANSSNNNIHIEEGVTILWRVFPSNHESFGHALLNEAFPIFMVMSNHFGPGPMELPRRVQLLVAADGWLAPTLPHVLSTMITHKTWLMHDRLQNIQQNGKVGVCFRCDCWQKGFSHT